MVNKQFKAESKQLLELMIHSIYSSKDIFLRELISNSSDALDKRHFLSLTDSENKYDKLEIKIVVDKENRSIKLIDNGIGMNEEDLENNLGTIASSGTKKFMEEIKKDDAAVETIGQFGVGFYSAFIVSDKVTVNTLKANGKPMLWESDGVDSYSITEGTRDEIGSEITLHIRAGEEFDQFLEDNTIKSLIKKYSNYIKYPIKMDVIVTQKDENAEENDATIEVLEEQTINSQKALWKRDKSEITDEEYSEFYKTNFFDFQDPLFTFHVKVEGNQNFEFLGFVPKEMNNMFETIEKSKGLDLYSKGVLIDKDVDYLIHPSFNFVKGLVDSSDLNLNISREMLQRDEVVSKLTKAINNRIKKELERKLKKDREGYNQFYEIYNGALSFGIYNNYGQDKDLFQDLVQFKSTETKEFSTFKEYLSRNEEADAIYYATGESETVLLADPYLKQVIAKGYDVLLLTGDVDEFAIKILDTYKEKPFKPFTEIELATEEEKEEAKEVKESNSKMLETMAEAIQNLKSVEIGTNLEDEACRLKSAGQISLEMERVLAKNPDGLAMPNEKVLELNPKHQIFNVLKGLEGEELQTMTKVLYNGQLVKEGLEVEDASEFAELLTKLMLKK